MGAKIPVYFAPNLEKIIGSAEVTDEGVVITTIAKDEFSEIPRMAELGQIVALTLGVNYIPDKEPDV